MEAGAGKLVTLTINGREVAVPAGTLLTTAAEAAGFTIPQFCAHHWLKPLGACRMCLVRIEGMPKLETACTTRVREGMVVVTESEEIRRAREAMLEFHLLNHPLECPVCDKGGECTLQDLTERHGLTASRYIEDKLVRPDSMLTPLLRMNYKRCIMCKRCVRYCEEVSASHLLKVDARGAWSHITTYGLDSPPDYFSGNTVDLCPVGAITSELFRFRGRSWELTRTRTVCNQCAVGCDVEVHTRLNELLRVVPAVHSQVDEGHLCDRGRFACTYANNLQFAGPLLGRGDARKPVSWQEAEAVAATRIAATVAEHGADAVGVLVGGGLTNEDFLAFRLFAHTYLGTANFFLGEGLIDVETNPLLILHSLFFDSASLEEILQSDLMIAVGCDLVDEAPVLALRMKLACTETGRKLVGICCYRPRGYWRPHEHYCYEPGNFLAAAGELLQAVEAGDTAGKWGALVRHLQTARTVAIVYGQHLLRHRNADKYLLALLRLKHAVYRWRGAHGVERGHISLNPVFRSANAIGAIVFNNLEFLVRSGEGRPTGPHATMRGILEKAASGRIKLLYLAGVNPLMTFVDRALVERAFAAAEFIIAQDVLPNETTDRADLVLPVSPWPCRDGTYFNLGWRLQRLRAAGLVRNLPSDLEILCRLLVRLGKGAHSTDPGRIFDEMARVTPAISHLRFDTIPETGSVLSFRLDEAAARAIAEETAKLDGGFPRYQAPPEYPLVLEPKLYLFRNSPRLRFSHRMDAVAPEAVAHLHPEDLRACGVADGANVVVESPNGSINLRARAAEWVQRGSVVVGNYFPEAPVNRLVSVSEEITFVRVRPA